MSMTDQLTPGPWVWCDWTILDEDRPAQGRGEPYWTMIPGSSALARGPLGRKSMRPESIIEALGYEVEGVAPANEADGRLIAASPELLAALIELERVASNWTGGNNKALHVARAAIAKAQAAEVEGAEQVRGVNAEPQP